MDILRVFAIIFGIGFVLLYLAVFVPAFMINDKLLGLLQIDAIHNIIHLLSGLLALIAAVKLSWSRHYFQVIGIFYAIITTIGFLYNGNFFGIMHMSMADHFFHLSITILSLYLGFLFKPMEKH